jgi:hypothetical protein
VAVWHDAVADTLNIQVNDGTVDFMATGGALQSANVAPLDIGRRSGTSSNIYWDGRIDQVMFWKRVLTSGERTQLYNSGSGVTVGSVITSTLSVIAWTTTEVYLTSTQALGEYYIILF